jgi:hypothetical protein
MSEVVNYGRAASKNDRGRALPDDSLRNHHDEKSPHTRA